MVSLTASRGLDTSSVAELPPSAAALVQFFMTFFLTFYNRHCFARYETLYDACMDILDGAMLFVHEMTISMNYHQLTYHRNLAAKYILATIYVFFMAITGGKLSPKEWTECVRKGLLTKPEAEALALYPGREVTSVLTCWAMVVIDDALEQDCLWQPHSQRIAHLHNRLNQAMLQMIDGCNIVAHTIAMPIPFPYYHLMNLVLVTNFSLLAGVLALLQTYLTIVPFAAVIAVFLGLRNVATQLADPFGDDDVDFPVAHFINYCVDQTMCLLETFDHMDQSFLDSAIDQERNFTDAQLTRAVDKGNLYKACGYKFLDEKYNWANATVSTKYEDWENIVDRMHTVFKPKYNEIDSNHESRRAMSADDVIEELEALYAETTKKKRALVTVKAEIKVMMEDMKSQGIPVPPKTWQEESKHTSAETSGRTSGATSGMHSGLLSPAAELEDKQPDEDEAKLAEEAEKTVRMSMSIPDPVPEEPVDRAIPEDATIETPAQTPGVPMLRGPEDISLAIPTASHASTVTSLDALLEEPTLEERVISNRIGGTVLSLDDYDGQLPDRISNSKPGAPPALQIPDDTPDEIYDERNPDVIAVIPAPSPSPTAAADAAAARAGIMARYAPRARRPENLDDLAWHDTTGGRAFAEARELIRQTLDHAGAPQMDDDFAPLPAEADVAAILPGVDRMTLEATTMAFSGNDELAIVPVSAVSAPDANDPRISSWMLAEQERSGTQVNGNSNRIANSNKKPKASFENFADARSEIDRILGTAKTPARKLELENVGRMPREASRSRENSAEPRGLGREYSRASRESTRKSSMEYTGITGTSSSWREGSTFSSN
jgi:predicted membrane chloride channel (bestrophin family)